MRYSNYLAQIAALIRKDPSITVREIAEKLQFADSKSVYYWLEKGNVSGINEFKRRVLRAERPDPRFFEFEVEGSTRFLVALPLFEWNPRQKNPVGEWYYLHTHPSPQGLFAVRVGTDQFGPWFARQDVLIISDKVMYSEQTWILLKTGQEFFLAKTIGTKFIHPATLASYSDSLTPVGTVLGQTRHFSV